MWKINTEAHSFTELSAKTSKSRAIDGDCYKWSSIAIKNYTTSKNKWYKPCDISTNGSELVIMHESYRKIFDFKIEVLGISLVDYYWRL